MITSFEIYGYMDTIVIANWKMHKTAKEAVSFVKKLKVPRGVKAYIAVPFPAIQPTASANKNRNVIIGAQNIHEAEEGAFTGEVSAHMVVEAKAKFVLVGHSERRRLFGETDLIVQKKISRALTADLLPVLCVGETLEERGEGKTAEILKKQLESALFGIKPCGIVIAYEPVWAIGTGKTALPEQAEEAHLLCRGFLARIWGASIAKKTPILYGGSVNGDNMPALVAQGNVNGALVGGASLDLVTFTKILQGASL